MVPPRSAGARSSPVRARPGRARRSRCGASPRRGRAPRRSRRRAAAAASRPSRMTCAFVEPTRHGTHLPQDSSRKNRSTLTAAASRSVPSAMTTIAPEPSMDPAACSVPKSSSTSSWPGPMKLEEAPPGWMAPSGLAAGHPAGQVEQFAGGGAHRHAVHAGALDVAGDGEELQPGVSSPFLPGALRVPPGRAAQRDDRDVRERLDRVHQRRLAVQAVGAGERRLVPRLAAVPFHALDQRRLLAEDVAARRGEHLDVQPPARAARVRADQAGVAQALDLAADRPAPPGRTRGG